MCTTSRDWEAVPRCPSWQMSLNWTATGIIIAEFRWLCLTLLLHFIFFIRNILSVDEPCIVGKSSGLTATGPAQASVNRNQILQRGSAFMVDQGSQPPSFSTPSQLVVRVIASFHVLREEAVLNCTCTAASKQNIQGAEQSTNQKPAKRKSFSRKSF